MPNNQTFEHITDLHEINSVGDILAELSVHEICLKRTKIRRLLYFSRAFAVINQAISVQITSDGFDNPIAMQKLQVNFARLYFNTLNQYARNGSLPMSWWLATKSWPASLSLFLAIRAHIVCDAHLAIAQTSKNDAVIEQDYFAVNQIILRSTKTVVHTYAPSTLLRPFREIARKTLVFPLCSLIFTMRCSAWKYQYRIEHISFKETTHFFIKQSCP